MSKRRPKTFEAYASAKIRVGQRVRRDPTMKADDGIREMEGLCVVPTLFIGEAIGTALTDADFGERVLIGQWLEI